MVFCSSIQMNQGVKEGFCGFGGNLVPVLTFLGVSVHVRVIQFWGVNVTAKIMDLHWKTTICSHNIYIYAYYNYILFIPLCSSPVLDACLQARLKSCCSETCVPKVFTSCLLTWLLA